MAQGFLTGAIWGVVVGGVGLVGASQILDRVEIIPPAPEASAVDVPAGSAFNREREDVAPVLPTPDTAPGGGDVPVVTQPETATATLPDTTPVGTPETAPLSETGLDAPETTPSPVIALGRDGALPGADVVAPDAPGTDVLPTADTTPRAPDTGAAPVEIPNPVADVDAPPVAVPDAPQGLRLPVPQIGDMVPGVTTDRLPRIGAGTEPPSADGVPALQANAIPFTATTDAPVVSIVLIDVGDARPDMAAFTDFPVPLTVALNPLDDDAIDLMRAYQAAGVEIAVLTPLPEGAAPADVEVAFQSFFSAVPQAATVLDLPEAVLQSSRPRASQVVAILAETGHGLVTYQKGLNSALQMADAANVPAAVVFREIDDGSHDISRMKRFLDQAAFRAGQEGTVILVAESRPETLAAVAEWALGSRASKVTLAPVSYALKP